MLMVMVMVMGMVTSTGTTTDDLSQARAAHGAILLSMHLIRMASGMVLGLGLAFAPACDTQASACHRAAIERFGCCPTCDGECRAKISETCAEEHDVPFDELEAEPPEDDADGDSSGGDEIDEPG